METTTTPDITTSVAQATTTTEILTTAAPTGNAVLVLSTRVSENKPMVITFEGLSIYLIYLILNFEFQGEVNDDVNFQYGSQTSVYDGCGFTLNVNC